MNKIESFIYNKVKNNYLIKNFLRNVYQGAYDLLPGYKSWFAQQPIVKEGYFYGFHDTTPFSPDNSKLLCNRLTIDRLRMPERNDGLEIGYLCGKDYSEWNCLASTLAWNYHKGCRLQWIDSDRLLFNSVNEGALGCSIMSVSTGESQNLPWPIDTASHDGRYATSFNYSRLQRNMPGYGYAWEDKDACMDENAPAGTGLFLVDFANHSKRLLLSLKDLAAIQSQEGMEEGHHFVTHTEFSPDDRYISFLHRWYNGTNRKTRLVVYDRTSKAVYVSPTTGMVSHYVWNNSNGIVAYCRMENIDSHVFFSDPTMRQWKRCGYPQLNSDGHHHFINDNLFVVDTYPDRRRHAKIYTVDISTDEVKLIVDAESPKQYVSPDEQHHWKCDLHPRCSADGTLLSFDSVHTGKRALCVMKL